MKREITIKQIKSLLPANSGVKLISLGAELDYILVMSPPKVSMAYAGFINSELNSDWNDVVWTNPLAKGNPYKFSEIVSILHEYSHVSGTKKHLARRSMSEYCNNLTCQAAEELIAESTCHRLMDHFALSDDESRSRKETYIAKWKEYLSINCGTAQFHKAMEEVFRETEIAVNYILTHWLEQVSPAEQEAS